jgi:glycosyltransferase involved in cell wall biosynthesis
MDLLWISDSPDTPSGFGNVTRFVCEGLARRGHRVNILGWQTMETHDWNGCRVYPNGSQSLGSGALFPLLLRLRPQLVVALGDVWWLPFFRAPHVRRQMEMIDAPWVLYFPIDGDTEGEHLPPSWTEMLREVDVPVAMSGYGRSIVERAGLQCHYIPHGVDLNVFSPPADRDAAKERVGASGKFLILSDSRNQPRKLLPRLLEIVAKLVRRCPDTLLHLHTDPDDEFARSLTYSYDVRADVRHLGLESTVRFSPGLVMKRGGGLSLSELAAYYQAADVHLLASTGEGFGLPTLQASASGAVPFASNYSASKELVEGHGEAIDVAEWTENEFGIRRGLIDVDDAVRKLARYYENRELLRKRSLLSRRFAESYGWEEIVDQWDKLIRSVARRGRRITRLPAVTSPSRVQELMPNMGKMPQGVSVKVKLVEHDYGRLEASILNDTRGQSSDVQIPTRPKASVTAGVKVVRRSGYVGMAPGDAAIFESLRKLFPVLSAWVPRQIGSDPNGVYEADESTNTSVLITGPEDARFEVAQSVLLLNQSGGLPEEILWDSALFGVPCVGSVEDSQQRLLWPEAAAHDNQEALALARSLLTNAAFAKRVARKAWETCRQLRNPDEKDVALWLRRLAAAQHSTAEAMAG